MKKIVVGLIFLLSISSPSSVVDSVSFPASDVTAVEDGDLSEILEKRCKKDGLGCGGIEE